MHLGHSGFVTSLALIDGGRTIVTGSVDGSIRAYLLDGEPVTRIDSTGPSNSVAWSLDGKLLLSGHFDGILRVHDSVTGALQHAIDVKRTGTPTPFGGVPGAGITADGSRLVAAAPDSVVISDARTLQVLKRLPVPNGMINRLALTSTSRFVTGAWNGSVMIWDAQAGARVRDWKIPGGVYCVAISRDGALVATASPAHAIVVWNADTGEPVVELPRCPGEIFCLGFSPDGVEVVVATTAGYVRVFDADSGDLLLDLTSQHVPLLSIGYSPDGKRLATGGFDGSVRICNSHTGKQLLTLRDTLSAPVASLAFSLDGKRLAAGDWAGHIEVWETEPAATRAAAIDGAEASTAAAASVLYPLLDQGESSAALATRFVDDQLLRVEVKAAIVRLATLEPYAAELDRHAWQDLLLPGVDPNRHRAALRKAEEACRLLPGRLPFERTRALAHVRLGEHHAAVSGRFARSRDMSPAGLAILAIAYHHLGRSERARELLYRIDLAAAADADGDALVSEARALARGR
ncbi:MAG: WD40 repeat domain-containing protein [Planctomycetota bacterium]